ncbi:hypothetical protein Tco_0656723 [Tanacetum coccineum]|uniref:Uncharacterized protein n=1 Tax=Tanacetum coccineum TaxID=301880 RepID=A0ABQ4X9J7_9ASTR
MRQGWDPRYKIWVEHGEPAPPTPPPVIDNTRQPLMSDMTTLLNDPDIIHFDNSSDLPLSTSLNDLDNATLHIDGQSTVVDAPPDIIDVPDEDDDIIGDEDALPHDLADSDVEDLINVDDDDVVAAVAGPTKVTWWRRVMIVPPSHVCTPVQGFALLTKCKDPTTGSYDVEAIRRARPEEITTAEWDKYIQFWNDPKNLARAAQNRLNQQKSVVTSRQVSRSLARLRDEMYEQASGHSGVPPYSLTPSGEQTLVDGGWSTREDEFNAVARGVQLRGPHSGVGVVLPSTGQIPGQKRLPQYSDMFKEIVWGGATGVGVWLMTSEE